MTTITLTPKKKVVKGIRGWIEDGVYIFGNRLPTEIEISRQLGVARGTVRIGLAEMVEAGVLERRRGVGTFVAKGHTTCPRHHSIAWMTPFLNTRHSLYNQILSGIESVTFSNNTSITFCNLNNSSSKTRKYIHKLKAMNISGVIFAPLIKSNYYEINSQIIDLLEQNDLQYVVVDTPVAQNGIIRGNFVGSDGYSIMADIVKYLIGLGHTRLGSIRVFSAVHSSEQRYNGIVDQLNREQLLVNPEYHLSVKDIAIELQGRDEIRQLMALDTPPTAICCIHDTIAKNVIEELRDMNLRVPEDISVTGFDDSYFSELIGLSTVQQPFYEIGRRAANIIRSTQELPWEQLTRIKKDNSEGNRQEFLSCEFVIRKTCAQVNKKNSKT